MVPYGVPPDVAHRMYRASEAFRASDRDFSGNLDPHEFKIVRERYLRKQLNSDAIQAMMRLGTWSDPYELDRIYYLIDTDRSGRVNEREFTEYVTYIFLYFAWRLSI